MTLRSLICFSALSALALHAATVSGRISLEDSRDPSVRKKSDYSGVVVWLEPAHEDHQKSAAPKHVVMTQKNKTFSPHVLAVPINSTVDFPNFDPIFHNAFSNYNGQLFDLGLYAPGSTKSVRFTRTGVVRIFCNIHSSMSALVVVLDTPYFAVTARDGKFQIPDTPPGDYEVHFFHERATPAALDRYQRAIVVRTDDLVLPPVSISESGYLPMPHANKYGQAYTPPPDDGTLYPAVRR